MVISFLWILRAICFSGEIPKNLIVEPQVLRASLAEGSPGYVRMVSTPRYKALEL